MFLLRRIAQTAITHRLQLLPHLLTLEAVLVMPVVAVIVPVVAVVQPAEVAFFLPHSLHLGLALLVQLEMQVEQVGTPLIFLTLWAEVGPVGL